MPEPYKLNLNMMSMLRSGAIVESCEVGRVLFAGRTIDRAERVYM